MLWLTLGLDNEKNRKSEVSNLQKMIAEFIRQDLRELNCLCCKIKQLRYSIGEKTGSASIVMSYLNYDYDIIKNAGVKLVGWPRDIAFQKPGSIGSVTDLRAIWSAIEQKELYMKPLSDEEKTALRPQIINQPDTNTTDQQSTANLKKKRRERSDKRKPCGPRKRASNEENDCDVADSISHRSEMVAKRRRVDN
jgi:hypothetical protein